MKTLGLLALFLANAPVSEASMNAEAIYRALNVREARLCDPHRGEHCPNSVETWVKAVGGLRCTKTENMAPGIPVAYECSLQF
jgi:hypothetical protein